MIARVRLDDQAKSRASAARITRPSAINTKSGASGVRE